MTKRYGYRDEPTLAQAFSDLRSDYDQARESRFRRRVTGLSPVGSGADYHYRSDRDYLKMLELSRHFDRNDPIVGQGVSRLIANVLQDGLKLDPATGDKEADTYLWDKWDEWTGDPDLCHDAGELNFHDLAQLAFRHRIVDGDVFFLPLKSGALQPIEGHRVRTPTNTKRSVVNGILLDEQRRRLEYWVTRDDVDASRPLANVADVQRIPARDAQGFRQVFHLYDPRRVSQTRGVTAFAPIANFVGMHDDIQFAKLVQQQVVSCFAVFRERAVNAPPGYVTAQRGEQTETTLPDGTTRTLEGIAPGMEIFGQPGEKLSGFSPNVPNAEFFQHAMLILSVIAINLDLPVAVLLLDPSQTNFSGWRGSIDQARLRFRQMQNWIRDKLYMTTYRWKVRQWLIEDERVAGYAAKVGPALIARHKWNRPRWPYIEPNKDASADVLRVRGCLISPRGQAAENGEDWDQRVDDTVADNAYAIRAAKRAAAQINAEFPGDDQQVHWRELIALPIPEGMTVQVGAAGDRESESGNNGGASGEGGSGSGGGSKPRDGARG